MVSYHKYHGARRPLFSQGHMLIEFKTGLMPFVSDPVNSHLNNPENPGRGRESASEPEW